MKEIENRKYSRMVFMNPPRKTLVLTCLGLAGIFTALFSSEVYGSRLNMRKPAAEEIKVTGPMSFETFHAQLTSEISETTKSKILAHAEKSSELQYQASLHESPWTLNVDMNSAGYDSDPKIPRSLPSAVDLNFANRDGLQIRTHNEIFEPSVTDITHVVPLQGLLTVGKDITRGGPRSPENIKADIKRSDAQASYLLEEVKYLNDLEAMERLSAAYFNLYCRFSDFDSILTSLGGILKAAKVKVDAKSLSMRDYLRLVDIQQAIEIQRQDYVETKQDIESRFYIYGESLVRKAKLLNRSTAICKDTMEVKIESSPHKNMIDESFYHALPSVVYAETERLSGLKTVEYLRKDMKLSLVPYIGTSYYSDSPTNYNRFEGIIGVRVTYNFAGPDKYLDIQSAAERVKYFSTLSRQAEQDNESNIRELNRNIEHSTTMIDNVQKRIANARQLIQVMQIQLDVGLIDPTSTAQVFLSLTEAMKLVRDLWESATSANLQLVELERAKPRVDHELHTKLSQ